MGRSSRRTLMVRPGRGRTASREYRGILGRDEPGLLSCRQDLTGQTDRRVALVRSVSAVDQAGERRQSPRGSTHYNCNGKYACQCGSFVFHGKSGKGLLLCDAEQGFKKWYAVLKH